MAFLLISVPILIIIISNQDNNDNHNATPPINFYFSWKIAPIMYGYEFLCIRMTIYRLAANHIINTSNHPFIQFNKSYCARIRPESPGFVLEGGKEMGW